REAQTGTLVEPDRIYRHVPERGVIRVDGVAEGAAIFTGASLLALHDERLSDSTAKSDARRLLKSAIGQYLSGRELRSREVLGALRRLSGAKHEVSGAQGQGK